LNLCLPFTIETDINTTVIGMQQAGPLANLNPLITPPVPMRAPPLTAGNVIGAPIRTPPLPPEPFAKFFDEKNLSARDVDRVRSALCAPENEGGGLDQETLMQSVVAIYEDTNRAEITNKLTKTERQNLVRDASAQARLAGQGKACGNTKTLNYFEWRTYANAAKDAKANAAAVEGLIRLLNVSVPGGQLNPKTTTLDAARSKIFAVRADPALANDLKFTKSLPAQFQNQMTRELFAALFKLRATQKPTEPPSDQPAPPAPPANQGNKP
jgi:hypothetical protein